ncbi:MAG: hypothetical protein G01um101456_89 [Parcubacteria group bacterium Gr01-1014_56]|nr:MAG: hypothetical protein G01um101456_89 [Parcubacteria group bacterium Gr01-1014_56]
MKKLAFATSFIALTLPAVALAQTNLQGLIVTVQDIFNLLIPLMIALALVVFFWGLVKYVWTSGEGHEEGKNVMIAGLVALFVMVSVWGIIRLAQRTLGITDNSSNNVNAPSVPPQR